MAQVLVPLQRLDRRTPRRRVVVDELEPFASDEEPAEDDVFTVPEEPRSGGIAYITVTDAAGRVLFRRPATAQEVDDALRSADEAASEGDAAMERIAYSRFYDQMMGGDPE